jgi:hypothetical protein
MYLTSYIATVVMAGGLALWGSGAPDPALGSLSLLFWFLANLLGEVLWLPAPRGRGYLSMATAANFATLVLLQPYPAVAITAAAGVVADFVFRRRRWYQALFNGGMCCVTVAASSWVFHRAGGASADVEALVSPLNVGPLALSAVTYFLINTGLVAGVVALHGRQPVWKVWRTSFAFPYELVGALLLSLLGFVFAILFLTWGYLSAFLAVIATYFVRDAYIRYVQQLEMAPPQGRAGLSDRRSLS